MNKVGWVRTWLLVAICATLGLVLGVAVANVFADRTEQFSAEATLAMLPDRNLSLDQASNFWEVLNRGQATGSAAIVLRDLRWLDAAAATAGVPRSDLDLTAGAIPNTTLITVTVKAPSAKAAEGVLSAVLADAVRPAAEVSGPFRLETVSPPEGSAVTLAPDPTQVFGASAVAGLVVGAGAGILISRSFGPRTAQTRGSTSDRAGDKTDDRAATTEESVPLDEVRYDDPDSHSVV